MMMMMMMMIVFIGLPLTLGEVSVHPDITGNLLVNIF